MLNYFQAVVMGLLQGVSELFPVSGSATRCSFLLCLAGEISYAPNITLNPFSWPSSLACMRPRPPRLSFSTGRSGGGS